MNCSSWTLARLWSSQRLFCRSAAHSNRNPAAHIPKPSTSVTLVHWGRLANADSGTALTITTGRMHSETQTAWTCQKMMKRRGLVLTRWKRESSPTFRIRRYRYVDTVVASLAHA